MALITDYKSYKEYIPEYNTWRENNYLQKAKRQEYLRRNPDAIKDYDLQRAKILLKAVDLMDKSTSQDSENFNIAFESATSLGLGYAAVGGTALGFLFSKMNSVKKFINKITKKYPKSKNIVSMGITAISGVVGIILAYPIYSLLSKIESNISRKRHFDTMENDLQDPKIFAVLDAKQKELFDKNIEDLETKDEKFAPAKFVKNNISTTIQIGKEALYYDKQQTEFRKKHERDISLQENELNEKEIKDAKKDRDLLVNLIRKINSTSQSYTEKMKKITDNLITFSFALGSLFSLGYERIAKHYNLKYSSLPSSFGIFLMVGSTFLATWAQKRAEQVGRFKAKQELKQNPEQLIYISSKKTNSIDDKEVELAQNKTSTNSIDFLKEFHKYNKEYQNWKKTPQISGKDISKAMENIELSPEQIQDGKRLQKNMFKTFYKVDSNTQNYSNSIEATSESIKYPLTLVLGAISSVFGLKCLAKLRTATKPSEIFKFSAKYVGIISLFTIPSLALNSYFAKAQKMGARISDMMTMKDLEDYRFFADYSRFKENA